ncbi:MAG: RIP metalloprotease RseP [Patescibacteria group bacterium]
MDYFFTIIVFLIIFSVIVLVHEFGHFIMAKRAGIRIDEFGIGLPPRVFGKKVGETIYSVNWIPFGGFVRMFGEDNSDPKAAKSSRSFTGKPMRARAQVIIAGVVMNFLLAWLLLFVGFSFGMEPLLTPKDVFPAVSSGQIVLEAGAKVKSLAVGSSAENVGFKVGDIVYSVNGEAMTDLLFSKISKDPKAVYGVIRDGNVYELVDTGSGIEFYDLTPFPRVKFFEVENYTDLYKAGLRSDDVIIKVNGSQVYTIEDFEKLIRGVPSLEYEVYRDGMMHKFIIERSESRKVIISSVIAGSPAEKAGIKSEDIILSVNGKEMIDSLELIKFVEDHQNEVLVYNVLRDGQSVPYEIKPENGKIGVYLSELMNYGIDQGVSVYNVDLLSSVIEIKDEKYPFYISIYKGLTETYRLSTLTIDMFIGFVDGFLKTGKIDDSVAGPVGIAQMTHVFMKEGAISIIRFMALLSLSLAAINILPFPALDGGRLLFILIELLLGRKIPQRWESKVHALGYVLILGLILMVTYSDILRLLGL